MIEHDLPKRIHQNRPSLILNIDNEYMTYLLMDEIQRKFLWNSFLIGYYKNSGLKMPQRHYFNRFVKDLRNYTLKYVDFMHYTVPLTTGVSGGFKFPSEYVG